MELTKRRQSAPKHLDGDQVKGIMRRLVLLMLVLLPFTGQKSNAIDIGAGTGVSYSDVWGLHAQLRTGLLVGGGIGFESLSMNKNNVDVLAGKQFHDNHLYNLLLGYRFRFESKSHDKLFFDIDPLLKMQVFKSSAFSSGNSNDYTSVLAEAHNINFQFAVSLSANYKIVSGLYAGLGVEPTWNIVTNGKRFDIPVLGRVGYNINNKIDLALTYRQGFTNTINTNKYNRGRVSDLSLSIFIPFTSK